MEASADINRTRSKNKNQHPGAIEVAAKRKRRTKAQIAEDNAIQEAKRKEIEREADEHIKNIANLEGKMARKDADVDSAHPRSRNGDIFILVTIPDVNNDRDRCLQGRIR
jgi:ATP-dependent exoDNAse (exonuclease V) beta subunit